MIAMMCLEQGLPSPVSMGFDMMKSGCCITSEPPRAEVFSETNEVFSNMAYHQGRGLHKGDPDHGGPQRPRDVERIVGQPYLHNIGVSFGHGMETVKVDVPETLRSARWDQLLLGEGAA